MADFVEQIWNCGIETVEGWHNTYRLCFENACKYDGLPPDTMFAVFSEDNPIVPHYEQARRRYLEEKANLNVFGYVGLAMNSRFVPTFKKQRKKRSRHDERLTSSGKSHE